MTVAIDFVIPCHFHVGYRLSTHTCSIESGLDVKQWKQLQYMRKKR